MPRFDVKVIGYEGIRAETAEDAMEQFHKFLDEGYCLSNLRWKSVEVFAVEGGGETREEESARVIRELQIQLQETIACLSQALADHYAYEQDQRVFDEWVPTAEQIIERNTK